MRDFRDSVAVVTGAASGIGRALAHRLADQGARIAISDVDEDGLEQTRAAVAQRGAEVQAWRLDVADRQAVYDHAEAVAERFGRVNLVINNAGVTIAGTVKDTSIEDFEWLMGINFWGVVYGTKAFLPHLERAQWGHIVNISSVFGIIAVPRQSSYNASKFAVRGFTEALRQELDAERSSVSCTCVHPGGIKTNIARAAKTVGADPWGGSRSPDKAASDFEKMARTTPADAARIIVDAAARNKKRVLVGPDAHAIDLIQRSMPTSYQKLVAKAVKPRGKRR